MCDRGKFWAWTFGLVGALFNPIIPVHLSRDTWTVVDLIVAGLFVLSTILMKIPKEKQAP